MYHLWLNYVGIIHGQQKLRELVNYADILLSINIAGEQRKSIFHQFVYVATFSPDTSGKKEIFKYITLHATILLLESNNYCLFVAFFLCVPSHFQDSHCAGTIQKSTVTLVHTNLTVVEYH